MASLSKINRVVKEITIPSTAIANDTFIIEIDKETLGLPGGNLPTTAVSNRSVDYLLQVKSIFATGFATYDMAQTLEVLLVWPTSVSAYLRAIPEPGNQVAAANTMTLQTTGNQYWNVYVVGNSNQAPQIPGNPTVTDDQISIVVHCRDANPALTVKAKIFIDIYSFGDDQLT